MLRSQVFFWVCLKYLFFSLFFWGGGGGRGGGGVGLSDQTFMGVHSSCWGQAKVFRVPPPLNEINKNKYSLKINILDIQNRKRNLTLI